jgi:hypothetical protein
MRVPFLSRRHSLTLEEIHSEQITRLQALGIIHGDD